MGNQIQPQGSIVALGLNFLLLRAMRTSNSPQLASLGKG